MTNTENAVMDEGKMLRGASGKIVIEFESVSGNSLQKRFNILKRYYAPMLGLNTGDWVAAQIKESLISNLQNGTIVVKVGEQIVGAS